MHLEGEKGAERVVRVDLPSGKVVHLEGERGAERKRRARRPGRATTRAEGCGEARASRHPDAGTTAITPTGWSGTMRAEGIGEVVRVDLPNGEVMHFEGERGAERIVRIEFDMPSNASRARVDRRGSCASIV